MTADNLEVLPPFVVSFDKRPWYYVALPGIEIITRASEEHTRRLLLTYSRSWQIENLVIPEAWLPRQHLPYTIIVDDTDPAIAGQTRLAASVTENRNVDLFGWSLSGWEFSSIAQKIAPLEGMIYAEDEDTTVLGANLYGAPGFVHAPTCLDRLGRCAPRLPDWVLSGLAGRFGLFENRTNTVLVVSHDSDRGSAAIFRGIRWISTSDSIRLQREFVRTKGPVDIPFIPLAEFFSESPPSEDRRLLWESEAGLLVRWGLATSQADRRKRFITLVERARSQPVSEELVFECFGFGYSALETQLKSHLRQTLGQESQFDIAVQRDLPRLSLKPADPSQVGRIIGDWLRMRGEALREQQPEAAKTFFEAADQALVRAWLKIMDHPSGGRLGPALASQNLVTLINSAQLNLDSVKDPSFLAVCGLYEHSAGEDKLARVLLEKAAHLNVSRPKACWVLAELRLRAAEAKPLGKSAAISQAQASEVIQILKSVLPRTTSSTPWRLLVETFQRRENTPPALNLDATIEGTGRFPRDSSLQLEVARLCLRAGEPVRALQVVKRALPLAASGRDQDELQGLRELLEKGSSANYRRE